MQELQLTNQMEIIGGGVGTWIVCVVVGAAVYKMLYSSSGRISIPRLVSLYFQHLLFLYSVLLVQHRY